MSDNKHSERFFPSGEKIREMLKTPSPAPTRQEALEFFQGQGWVREGSRLECTSMFQKEKLDICLEALGAENKQALGAKVFKKGAGWGISMDKEGAQALFMANNLTLPIAEKKVQKGR